MYSLGGIVLLIRGHILDHTLVIFNSITVLIFLLMQEHLGTT